MGQQEFNLDNTCQDLVAAFSNSLSWQWDDRFDGVLAEFDIENKDYILETISNKLGHSWDSASISTAPRTVRKAMKNFGGLQAGQLLFTSEADQDVILLGLWWPWGNGTTISIRLVPYSPKGSGATTAILRQAFAL